MFRGIELFCNRVLRGRSESTSSKKEQILVVVNGRTNSTRKLFWEQAKLREPSGLFALDFGGTSQFLVNGKTKFRRKLFFDKSLNGRAKRLERGVFYCKRDSLFTKTARQRVWERKEKREPVWVWERPQEAGVSCEERPLAPDLVLEGKRPRQRVSCEVRRWILRLRRSRKIEERVSLAFHPNSRDEERVAGERSIPMREKAQRRKIAACFASFRWRGKPGVASGRFPS